MRTLSIKCIAGDKSDGVPGIRIWIQKAYILLNNIKRPIDSIEDLGSYRTIDVKHKILDNWDIVERIISMFDEIIKHIPYLAFNEFNRLDNQEKFLICSNVIYKQNTSEMGGIV